MAAIKPIASNRFYLSFAPGLEDKMVKSVSELKLSGQNAGAQKPVASGKKGMTKWQNTAGGYEECPTFTVEVYVAQGDMDFYNWVKAVTPKSEKGEGKGSELKDGSLVAYDQGDEEVMRWEFTACVPKSYKLSDNNVEGNEFFSETLEITCQRVKRVK